MGAILSKRYNGCGSLHYASTKLRIRSRSMSSCFVLQSDRAFDRKHAGSEAVWRVCRAFIAFTFEFKWLFGNSIANHVADQAIEFVTTAVATTVSTRHHTSLIGDRPFPMEFQNVVLALVAIDDCVLQGREHLIEDFGPLFSNLAIYLTPPAATGCGSTSFANGIGPIWTACCANR